MRANLHLVFVCLVLVSTRLAAAPATRPSLSSLPSANALLGNPSGASANPKDRDNYLLTKSYFVASYNSSTGQPNWVSWVVTKEDLGDAPRKRVFDTDTTLPIGLRRIKATDYANSGFDRGHMCPRSDRAATKEQSYSTFVMTNIIPQAPNVNQRAWHALEDYGRQLAAAGSHVYVIAGPVGKGGIGSKGPAEAIGPRDHPVLVPAKCWKILVVVPEAGGINDLRKINKDTRVIAVMMPNDDTQVKDDWSLYRVSVTAIEKETGYKFFNTVPGFIATALKAKVDETDTPKPVPTEHGD